MAEEFTGYLIDEEDRGFLQSQPRIPFSLRDFEAPEEIDPRQWHRIENQANQGSCHLAGTPIRMADGTEVPIEQVSVNSMVVTHKKRSRRVTERKWRNFTGDLITIEAKGYQILLTVTEDHPILAKRSDTSDKLEWVPAGQLTESDRVIFQQDWSGHQEVNWIRCSDFIDGEVCEDSGQCWRVGTRVGYEIPSEIEVSEDLGRLLGLYVAEGHVSKEFGKANRVTFTFHYDEKRYQAETVALLKSVFCVEEVKVIHDKKHNKTDVRCANSNVAAVLEGLCGRLANAKHLPKWAHIAPVGFRRSVLRAWFDGDGCDSIGKTREANSGTIVKKRQVVGVTVSRELARGMFSLASSIGLCPTVNLRKEREGRQQAYSIYLYSNCYAELYPEDECNQGINRKMARRCTESGLARKIKKLSRQRVENQTVHNIEVEEDHSYFAEMMCCHNCVGHGLSSTMEYCFRIKTGEVIQFSRQGAYILSQKQSGISGDRGATISGAVKASEQVGLPTEATWPYPNPVRYDNRIPPGALEEAKDYRIQSSTWLDSYSDIFTYLSGGAGGVIIGIIWDSYCRNCTGILERYSGGGSGGHCVCFLGYSRRKDGDGRRYLWMANSHSRRWGADGWAEVSPAAVQSMCNHRYWSGAGLSDLSVDELKPRKFQHTTENMGF